MQFMCLYRYVRQIEENGLQMEYKNINYLFMDINEHWIRRNGVCFLK